MALMPSLLNGCANHDGPPGMRWLAVKQKKLRRGMTVAEVDAVMAGCPRKESREIEDHTSKDGTVHRSTLKIIYEGPPAKLDGPYILIASFDEGGRYIGSEINVYAS